MVTTTRLRMFRRAHGITLDELAKRAGFSNQWLSFLELGKRERTAPQEEKLSQAIEALLAERHSALSAMERNFLEYRGRLLEPVEVESDEP